MSYTTPSAGTSLHQVHRVILLLDLDAFYAQCESLRLGYDATVTPLALLQWNSVLAVTYPARTLYDIKRGDTWAQVAQKSNGQCLAVHVPILTNETVTTAAAADNTSSVDAATLVMNQDYNSVFQMNALQQQQARKQDIGVRRYSQEGKALIERYRIASRQIFATVLDVVEMWNAHATPRIVLERASIDELFLDVTGVCCSKDGASNNLETHEDYKSALEATKVIGEVGEATKKSTNDDSEEVQAIQRGCILAYHIRKYVKEKLGFTISAGISRNKTLAKLSAGYGKPNGQAVTYPSAIEYLLSDTKIGKCRNFGGKLGAKVQALLPSDAPRTIHSIAKFLSLPDLERGFGDAATARWVYCAAKGIDDDLVVANESALIKSITAFKSLPFHNGGHTVDQILPWIELLAKEVVARVEQDASRNHRYPKSCNICYAAPESGHHKHTSIRMPFPAERLTKDDKIKELVDKVPKLVASKAGPSFRFHRIGLCADSFMIRASPANAIASYLVAKSDIGRRVSNIQTSAISDYSDTLISSDADLELAQKIQKGYYREGELSHDLAGAKTALEAKEPVDADREIAMKLQASYDRESRLLDALDRREQGSVRAPKARRIDSYFRKP
jgi:DNA polymerase eta